MQLLVAGSDRVDAGKTTFSAGLVAHTDAVPYKPRAGNDYWHDHEDVMDATADGRLYGKDAKKLVSASDRSRAPESINPVHRLWTPSPGPKTGLLGDENREFLVDRVGESYVVNETVPVPATIEARLPLDDPIRVASLEHCNEVMRERHLPALNELGEEIASQQRAVIESYADIARPLHGLEPDAVAVVEPTQARIYDGQRYSKACAVASGGPRTGQLEERVGSVIDLIDDVATIELPPLRDAERGDPDRIAAAYESAYDRLVAAAIE
jgi:predicted P-loop ATPase/GTPase